MLSALFWYITQRELITPYRRFGTPYPTHLQRSNSKRTNYSLTIGPWMMGTIGRPETSAWIYHTMLRKIPEDGRSHLHRGGSLTSQKSKNYPKVGLRQMEFGDVKWIQLALGQDTSVLLAERPVVFLWLLSRRVNSSLTLCVRSAGEGEVAMGGHRQVLHSKKLSDFFLHGEVDLAGRAPSFSRLHDHTG